MQLSKWAVTRLAVVLCVGSGFAPMAVADPPLLGLSGSLSLTYQLGGPPPTGVLVVTNVVHGNMQWFATVSNAPWASLSPSSGSMPETFTYGVSETASVTVNPAGLKVGSYAGSITVTATSTWGVANSPQTIPISLVIVDNGGAVLSVNPSSLSFGGVQGTQNGGSASIAIANTGMGSLQWSASVTPAVNWLSISSGTGSIAVSASGQQLTPGSYSASIVISAPGAQPPTASVSVTLIVRAPSPPSFRVDTSPLTFKSAVGAPSPPAQKVSVANAGEASLNWFASAPTTNGGGWLKISPVSGTNSGQLSISADTTGLSAGIYVGKVILTAAGVDTFPAIPVTLTLIKPASFQTTTITGLSFNAVTGTSNPANQTISFKNGGDAPLSWQAAAKTSNGNPWLKVSPASGTGDSQIVVSVDDTGMALGTYSGQIVLTCDGGCTGITVPVTSAVLPLPSAINAPGVLSAARLTPGSVSAGSVATVFGARLGPDAGVTGKLDSQGLLATSLGGTTVMIDGTAAPLFYVGGKQINFQIPYEVAGKTKAHMVIQPSAAQASELDIALVPASFALFTTDGSQAAALNQDYSYNAPATPITAGNVVLLFGTGQGPLDKPVATGAMGPSNPPFPAPAVPLTMTVNGEPANVLFAGAAPGLVGLLQINLQIPQDIPSGPATVTFQQGDSPGGQSVVVYVQAMTASPPTSPGQ